MVRDTGLALDQQPAARVVLVDLRSWQEVNVVSQQLCRSASASYAVLTTSVSAPSSPTRKIESDMPVMLRASSGGYLTVS
jgi:hypothetical protein